MDWPVSPLAPTSATFTVDILNIVYGSGIVKSIGTSGRDTRYIVTGRSR